MEEVKQFWFRGEEVQLSVTMRADLRVMNECFVERRSGSWYIEQRGLSWDHLSVKFDGSSR